MRRVLATLFLILTIYFAWSFKYTYTTKIQEPNIDKELRKVATKEYLNSKIKEAIELKKLEDAKSYIALANYLKVPIDSTILKAYRQEQMPINSAIRGVKEFADGFITGKSSSTASFGGSVVSDFTVVGDLRDSYKEGSKYLANKPYDKFLLNISLIGLALTATTYTTLGSSSPIKVGASVIKTAYKSGKLTKGFIKTLDKKLSQSVDLKLLKKADFSSLSKMKKLTKAVIKSINPKPLKALFKELNRIKTNTSLSDTIKLLKYVDSEQDLAKVAKLSSKYKKSTLGVFKVLGKRVLRAGKVVVKYTTKFIINIIGFILSIIGFFFMLFAPRLLKGRLNAV